MESRNVWQWRGKNCFIPVLRNVIFGRTSRFFQNLVLTRSPWNEEWDECFAPRRNIVRVWTQLLLVCISLMLVPWEMYAQTGAAALTGVVTDTSGAVLPGVTVEARSPLTIIPARFARMGAQFDF